MYWVLMIVTKSIPFLIKRVTNDSIDNDNMLRNFHTQIVIEWDIYTGRWQGA